MSTIAMENREKAAKAITQSLREAKNCNVLGIIDLQGALNSLEDNITNFNDAHTAVMTFCGSATRDFESSIPGPVEATYNEAKSLLLNAIKSLPAASSHETASTSFINQKESPPDSDRAVIAALQQQVMSMQQMMLVTQNRLLERPAIDRTITPRVKVPTFNGDLDQWTQYHDLFVSLIGGNNVLSGAEKLHHLKASLSGDAELLLRPFSITNGNFIEAWTTLRERYHNPRVIIAKHLDNILEMKALTHEDASQLRRLVNVANESVRSLRVLGEPIQHWNRFLVHVVSKKLDPVTKRQWDLHVARNRNDEITFTIFMEFVEIHCRANETNPVTKASSSSTKSSNASHKSTSSHHASTNNNSTKCPMCSQSHYLQKCSNFKELDVTKRREIVKQKQLCFNCLSPNHGVNSCKSNFSCSQCKQRHHTMLHIAISVSDSTAAESPQSSRSTSNAPTQSTAAPSVSTFFANSVIYNKNIMLATALATIQTSTGNHSVRMLFDSGSESSFVTEDLVQRLLLKKVRSRVSVTGLGGTSSGNVSGVTHFTVQASDNSFAMPMEALIMRRITNDLPRVTTQADWSHIKGIKLADPTFFVPGRIDILLGADYYNEVIDSGILRGQPGTPIAQQTKFGWILSGAIAVVQKQHIDPITLHAQVDLDNSLQKFWEIEEVFEKPQLTAEEDQCEQHFLQTHHRSPAGRYTVQLPLRQPVEALGGSKQIATTRLTQMERRFISNEPLRAAYTAFMDEYRALGHMTEVQPESSSSTTYYLPHHAVLKPDSSTTKLRVVFDASSKGKLGKSLNDLLMVGPRLQENLYDILLRFRKHNIAISADVTKMYRQIEIDPIHRDYQRILWRNLTTEPIREFQLNTVTYGTSAAPHLAVRTLQQLAIDEQQNFPSASAIVLNDFYVDDMLTGSDTSVGAIEMYNKTTEMLQRGGFHLRKWVSNSDEVLKQIPMSHRELHPEKELDQESVKTLGLRWNPSTDTFLFKCTPAQQDTKSTKRTLLSDIAKLFDPIGFLAPVIIVGKVMFQQLWLRELTWDDPLPADIAQDWATYRQSLHDVNQIAISRWLYTDSTSTAQLHGFADASERAYAAAIYMRSTNKDGQVKVSLISAKTKVAPTKQLSLPRLELCAAVLMAKLMCKVKRALHLETTVAYAWSDSTITLSWIKSQSTNWKTFIANRVSQIQQRIDPVYWNHVVSAENPADCATRGLSPLNLASFHLWWNGPTWLQNSENDWPKTQLDEHTDLERKTKSVSLLTTTIDIIFTPFSSWVKCKRVAAYCLRFIENCKHRQHGLHRFGCLTTSEMECAAKLWIRQAQDHHYHAEIVALKANRPFPSKSKLSSLTPFYDGDGLLRVGGRMHNSKLNLDQKHQIILPPEHPLTESILREIHQQHLHAGNQLMLAILRSKFWIPGARSVIRHLIHQCMKCFKFKAAAQSQLMGSLPTARVTPGRAFIQTGVDYAGPITLRVSYSRGPPKTYKAYIAVFVCMATRAIHLEVVSDMTSISFIAAYHRFTSRRGRCTDLHSDNGTTFKGADNEMQTMLKQLQHQQHNQNIAQTLLSEGTNWHYIPPAAPHFGGLWEAGVKATKHHLRRTMGASLLTYEDIQTLLCQIEACLNSRPLCPMSDDPDDFETLTPGHFLIGQPITAVPEADLTTIKNLPRYQQIQRQKQQFWKQWTSEYLARLQQRPKWSIIEKNVKIDQLVIVMDDNQPPTKWKMARITAVHPGKDDLVRVITIIDAERKLRKLPITKICVLPFGSKEDII